MNDICFIIRVIEYIETLNLNFAEWIFFFNISISVWFEFDNRIQNLKISIKKKLFCKLWWIFFGKFWWNFLTKFIPLCSTYRIWIWGWRIYTDDCKIRNNKEFDGFVVYICLFFSRNTWKHCFKSYCLAIKWH